MEGLVTEEPTIGLGVEVTEKSVSIAAAVGEVSITVEFPNDGNDYRPGAAFLAGIMPQALEAAFDQMEEA